MADTNAGPPSGSSSRIDELRARWEGDRSSRIFLQLAEELRRHQRVDEALAVLEVGVEQHPQWGAAQVALGRCRIELGRYELGCLVLETVVRKDPTQMVAYRLLVDGYLGMGEADQARDRLELYSELNPQDQDLAELKQRVDALAVGTVDEPATSAAPPPPPPVPAPVVESRDVEAPAVEAPVAEAPLSAPPPPLPESSPVSTISPMAVPPSPIGHGSELFTLPSSDPEAPVSLDLSNLTPARRLSRPGFSEPGSATAVLEPPPEAPAESFDPAPDTADLPSPPEVEPDDLSAEARKPLSEQLQGPEKAVPESAVEQSAPEEEPPPIGADVQLQAPIVIDAGTGEGPPAVGDAPTLETRSPLSGFDAAVPAPTDLGSEDSESDEAGSEDHGAEAAVSIEELAEPIEMPDQIDLGAAEVLPEPPPALSQEVETEPLIRDPARFDPPPPLSSTGELPALPTTAPPAATSTLGELYLDQGHAEEARDIFEQVLDRDPENEKAREGLHATIGDGASDTQVDSAAQPPPALDAMTLLRGHQAAEEGGVTERKSAVLEAYLHRIRPPEAKGEGSDVP